MNPAEFESQLRADGFTHTYVWEDGPGAFYHDHTHPTETAHVIIHGEMTITCDRGTKTCKPGERFDVPAHTVHCAKVGPQGCRYLIGEK